MIYIYSLSLTYLCHLNCILLELPAIADVCVHGLWWSFGGAEFQWNKCQELGLAVRSEEEQWTILANFFNFIYLYYIK